MPHFVGLDLETTSSDLVKGAKICQLGMAFGACDGFTSDVGWPLEVCDISEEALAVNKFTRERIAGGPPPETIDAAAAAWLVTHHAGSHGLIAVGWNVAGFDLPFVRAQLPQVADFFSYRTADLNAICFALGKPGRTWEAWKKQAKQWATTILGTANWHDAGFDAAAGLLAFYWLQDQLRRAV
jgi:DNA polymerase III epsilon subunit-like protein